MRGTAHIAATLSAPSSNPSSSFGQTSSCLSPTMGQLSSCRGIELPIPTLGPVGHCSELQIDPASKPVQGFTGEDEKGRSANKPTRL